MTVEVRASRMAVRHFAHRRYRVRRSSVSCPGTASRNASHGWHSSQRGHQRMSDRRGAHHTHQIAPSGMRRVLQAHAVPRSQPQPTGTKAHPGNQQSSAGRLLTSHHTRPRRLRSCSGIVTGASSRLAGTRWRRRVARNRDTCRRACCVPCHARQRRTARRYPYRAGSSRLTLCAVGARPPRRGSPRRSRGAPAPRGRDRRVAAGSPRLPGRRRCRDQTRRTSGGLLPTHGAPVHACTPAPQRGR